jgi:hypothetical protein
MDSGEFHHSVSWCQFWCVEYVGHPCVWAVFARVIVWIPPRYLCESRPWEWCQMQSVVACFTLRTRHKISSLEMQKVWPSQKWSQKIWKYLWAFCVGNRDSLSVRSSSAVCIFMARWLVPNDLVLDVCSVWTGEDVNWEKGWQLSVSQILKLVLQHAIIKMRKVKSSAATGWIHNASNSYLD